MSSVPVDFAVWQVGSTKFCVPVRYENLEWAGAGAFSSVAVARDRRLSRQVAIKKLAHPFRHAGHARRTFRELRLLSCTRHPCVVRLLHAFSPQLGVGEVVDVYLVMPKFQTDLRRQIDNSGPLGEEKSVEMSQKLLQGVRYLHRCGILHRDIKPENLAVQQMQPECRIKILDFGLARTPEERLSGYVITRHYRSPEVMGSPGNYGAPADVWSVGCVMAEMLTGCALFPGKNELHMLSLQCERLGRPSRRTLAKFEDKEAADFVRSLSPISQRPPLLPSAIAGDDVVDLVRRLLDFDPDSRVTADEALSHFVFKHLPQERLQPRTPVKCEFEDVELSVADWRREVAALLAKVQPVDQCSDADF